MAEKENPTLKVIAEKCRDIKYGSWEIRLKIHQGRVVGFEQIKSPLLKYSENWEKEKEEEK